MKQDRDRSVEHESMLFRWLAGTVLVGAVFSVGLSSLVDAGTIATRAEGIVDDGRPLWLHTFSIAMVTCAVAAVGLWLKPGMAVASRRTISLITAGLNLTVPVLGLARDELRPVLPIIHTVLSGLLIVIAVLPANQIENTEEANH